MEDTNEHEVAVESHARAKMRKFVIIVGAASVSFRFTSTRLVARRNESRWIESKQNENIPKIVMSQQQGILKIGDRIKRSEPQTQPLPFK